MDSLKVYYDKDANLDLIKNKKIAILGYGSQGRSQALNLRDSGLNVIVAQRKGSLHYDNAINDGFNPISIKEAVQQADWIQMLLPDELQKQIWQTDILPNLKEGTIVGFAHGFNITFNQILPTKKNDIVMISPKGVGPKVRSRYIDGQGVPGLIAIEDNVSGMAKEYALAFAKGVGLTKSGVLETTFKEETQADLFGEQAVLCGGIIELVCAAFNTLVKGGCKPEMAYFECFYEMKLIVDLLFEGGIAKTNTAISDTAEYGEYVSGKKVITKESIAGMEEILKNIQSGKFAKEWINEAINGKKNLYKWRKEVSDRKIEQVGQKLRELVFKK